MVTTVLNPSVDELLLESYSEFFGAGDKSALLQALRLCLENNRQVPAWVNEGMVAALSSIFSGRTASWDDVFGSAKALSKEGKRWSIAHKVLMGVIAAETNQRAIDDNLFDEIGKSLHISGGKAKQHYYAKFGARRRASKQTSKKLR